MLLWCCYSIHCRIARGKPQDIINLNDLVEILKKMSLITMQDKTLNLHYPKVSMYVKHIDGLRAFAVLLVVLMHLNVKLLSGGFVGVDVFFVISGFLITGLINREIILTGKFSFLNFYTRRIKRILPALIFTLLIVWLLGYLLFSANHFYRLGSSLSAAALSYSNVFFWTESGYFDLSSQLKPLLHTWSLGVEEQFYLLWPAFIYIISVKFDKKYLFISIILISLISVLLNFMLQNNHLDAVFYLMPFRIFEFGVGALMVWAMSYKVKKAWLKEVLCISGFFIILYAAISYDEITLFPSYNAFLPILGAALIIYAGNAKYCGFIFNNRIARGIGLISYSLYLIHWPLIVYYKYYSLEKLSLISQIVILLVSIIFSVAMYFFIEQPFRKGSNKQRQSQLKILFRWIPATLVVALLGFSSNFGIIDYHRNDENLLKKAQQPKKFHLEYFGGTGFPYPFGWTYNNGKSISDVVLMGDSHAQMLQYGLNKVLGEKRGLNIYMAGSSCLVLPGVSRIDPGDDWDSICPNVLKTAMIELNKNKNSSLLLSESWFFQIAHGVNLNNKKPLEIDLNSKKYVDYAGLTQKLDKLHALIGDRLLIIFGDVPGAGREDSASCFMRPALGRVNCYKKMHTERASVQWALNINTVLKKYALLHENVIFFDPYSAFCDEKECASYSENNEPYYSDEYHLSMVGSEHIIRVFEKQLNEALNGSIYPTKK